MDGGEQIRPVPKDNLSFFMGWVVGPVGSNSRSKHIVTYLFYRLAPFREHKGGVGPFSKNPRRNSACSICADS